MPKSLEIPLLYNNYLSDNDDKTLKIRDKAPTCATTNIYYPFI